MTSCAQLRLGRSLAAAIRTINRMTHDVNPLRLPRETDGSDSVRIRDVVTPECRSVNGKRTARGRV